MNSGGMKNAIIGTVSFTGSDAAFFSASDMRISRMSPARTRRAVPIEVPYFSAWRKAFANERAAASPVRWPKFLKA
jgi:hypothetical protein